jgi:esterase
VLVHGSRLHAHVWNDFARRASDRYHIIAIDQRGHGESAWGGDEEYRLEDLCVDLHAHVQARKLSRYTLVGHSLGGRVSLLYAHRHQSELERLVLVDITPGRRARALTGAGRVEGKQPREFESEDAAIAYLARAMARAPRHLVEESVRHGMRRTDAGRYVWKYDPVHFARRVKIRSGAFRAPRDTAAGTGPVAGRERNRDADAASIRKRKRRGGRRACLTPSEDDATVQR